MSDDLWDGPGIQPSPAKDFYVASNIPDWYFVDVPPLDATTIRRAEEGLISPALNGEPQPEGPHRRYWHEPMTPDLASPKDFAARVAEYKATLRPQGRPKKPRA